MTRRTALVGSLPQTATDAIVHLQDAPLSGLALVVPDGVERDVDGLGGAVELAGFGRVTRTNLPFCTCIPIRHGLALLLPMSVGEIKPLSSKSWRPRIASRIFVSLDLVRNFVDSVSSAAACASELVPAPGWTPEITAPITSAAWRCVSETECV